MLFNGLQVSLLKREVFDIRKDAIAVSLLVISLTFWACAREWQNPDTTVPAKELSIVSILASPIAYDSAGVIVEGKVWGLRFDSVDEKNAEIPYTSFKLADKEGNFVNVFALGDIPVSEGDMVRVVGIYRREYNSESYKFRNEIEAKRIENKSP